MKKIKLLLLTLFVFSVLNSYADIILTRPRHPLKVYIKVDNTEQFSNIVIIGVSDCPAVSKKPFIVNADSDMELSKSCSITLYAVKKDYLEEKGLSNIKWKKDKNIAKINQPVKLEKGTFSENPNDRMEIHLTIVGFNEKEMIIYKSSQVYKYSNKRHSDTVENFDFDGDRTELKNDF
ncbi:MAG: hypothetical protein ACK5KT_10860 [Dysgonomonas sp.]